MRNDSNFNFNPCRRDCFHHLVDDLLRAGRFNRTEINENA